MGKSNNRKDIDDYGDDYGDYGDTDTGMTGYVETDSMLTGDPAQASTVRSTTTKAKMSSQKAKQQAKRSNQTDR
jgi:hypothetical protein